MVGVLCVASGVVGPCSSVDSLGSLQVVSVLVILVEGLKTLLFLASALALVGGLGVGYLIAGGWRR
jgi:hypothetical protein